MHGNLWLASPHAARHFDPGQLSDAERNRLARLRREGRRQEFAVSRALRLHVTRTAPHPASESLSHSGGYAALAQVGPELRVGVDIEHHRPRDVVSIARTAFTDSEAEVLECVGDAERERLFYAMWTIKEALAKALQLGLLVALRRCEVAIEAGGWQVRIPAPAGGSVAVYQPRTDLTLAVACIGENVAFETWNWPPQEPAAWPLIASASLSAAVAPRAAAPGTACATPAAPPATAR
jgi:phosphopantetheinyl transferase (holo-ACP synthase)